MPAFWNKWFATPAVLRRQGVIGLNMRNARYLLPNNPRRFYKRVDNKLETKIIAREVGIACPETYGIIESPRQLRNLDEVLASHSDFVIKPAHGSGGRGIVVIAGRIGGHFIKASGSRVTLDDLKFHITNILGGLFSLGGKRDKALIEYRVRPLPMFQAISYQGVPDIRVMLFHGYPVMAMMRLSTRESDGRSNLHKGAVGVGIDLGSGAAVHAVCHNEIIESHPDTQFLFKDIVVPDWPVLLELATRCYEVTGLGYLGVDMMVDVDKGPLLIEINARPGLAIQAANGSGLATRLIQIAKRCQGVPDAPVAERLAFSMETFSVDGRVGGISSATASSSGGQRSRQAS